MSKGSEYEHHQPRASIKKKKVFNEEAVLENRGSRVGFKNYIRQLQEEELDEEYSSSEWVVKRGVSDSDDVLWQEVGTYLSEEEAEEEADRCRDVESDDGIQYKVEEV